MRMTPWLIGAAAAAMIGFAGTAASAAPAAPGLKPTAGEATVVEKAHRYRRHYRRYYGGFGIPYVYLGPRYPRRTTVATASMAARGSAIAATGGEARRLPQLA